MNLRTLLQRPTRPVLALLAACALCSVPGWAQAAAQQPLPMLSTKGTQWTGAQGKPVQLKGANLGNWLIPEFWMMGYGEDAKINDQCTLEAVLDKRFGRAERERLVKLHRDNWITERDWDLLAAFRFNIVRLPFMWSVVEDEQNPGHLRPDAWVYLDKAIAEAGKRGIYVILDLHGAVGAQGHEHHSGCAHQNKYWSTPAYQQRTVWLWQEVAKRYKDNSTVAAYDLLNEPWGSSAQHLATVVRELSTAVRAIDKKHIILLPDHPQGNIAAYGNPADHGMVHVAFETHPYPGFFGWGKPGRDIHKEWLQCKAQDRGICQWVDRTKPLNTPLLIGEFQPWADIEPELSGQITRASYDRYAELGFAATAWSYKKLSRKGGRGPVNWGLVTNAPSEPVPELNFETAPLAEIEAFFKHFGSMKYEVNEPVMRWMNSKTAPRPFD